MGEAEQSTPKKMERRECLSQCFCKPPSILHLARVVGKWQQGKEDGLACWVFTLHSIGPETEVWRRRAPHPDRCMAMFVFLHCSFTSLLLFLSCCFVVRQRHDVISTSQISGALFISTPYKFTFYCFVRLPFSFLSFSNHNKTRYTAQAMPGVLWCFSSFIMSDFNLRAKRQCCLLNSWFSLFCPFPCIPILKFRGASSKTRYDYTVVIIVAKHWSNGTNET